VYGTTTLVNGEYTLPSLRVGGPYTVTATYVGYQKQEITDITLRLSQTAEYNFQLPEQAVQTEAVLVTGERSAILSAAHTGASTNVQRAQIDQLPTITRTFQDYFKLSPYFSGVNYSVVGRNAKYNNIQIDGANFNDLFGLGSSGTPAGQASVAVAPISLDAIEEFRIEVSPFDVRHAGFTGAGINAITRSGTNTFTGSVSYSGRNQDFAGVSPDALQKKLPDFTQNFVSFRLGGPVVQNKLFFFVNGELARAKSPFTRTFDNDKVGTNAYTASSDSLKILSDYLKSKYGYDTGSWSSIPQDDNSDKFFLRFDYNLSESHKLTARYNYLKADDDNAPSRFRFGTGDIYSENARYLLQDKTHSFALQLTSLFGNSASNELILGYVNQFDNPVYYGTPFPTVEVRTVGSGSDKTVQRLAVGSEEFRHYNELGQKYFEITDNLSLYFPNHTVTLGAKLDIFKFRNLFIPDGFGFYRYNSVAGFLAGGKPDQYAFRYSATSNPKQEANWGANQLGFYAQDEWSVTPTFKLTGGVRVDIPTYPESPNNNAAFDSTFSAYGLRTDTPPKTTVAVSPRLGFNWAVDEERNTQVRGGVGIFYGRFPYVWVSNQYSNTGVDFYTVTSAPSSFIADPNGQPKVATGLPTAEVDITDRDFKAPSILRTNIAIDHRLPFDIVASVEGIFSWTRNDVYYQNINLAGQRDNGGLTPGGKLVGEGREVWGDLNTTTGAYSTAGVKVNSRFTAAYLVTNTDQGSNSTVTVQLQRQRPGDPLYANVAYTWGLAKDLGGQNSTTASSGWRFNPTPGNPNNPVLGYADNDRRHRIMGTASYRFDWGWQGLATTVGVFYNGISGSTYSWVINGDVNGDGLFDNDLFYIPKSADDVTLMSAASGGTVLPKSDPAYVQLMALVNGDSYMTEHKGEMLQRNALHGPWQHQVDLRLTQEIPTIRGHRLMLTLDILNVLNFLNKEWGWIKIPSSNPFVMTFNSVGPSGTAEAGKARYYWTNPSDPSVPSNTLSRWSAQLGASYTF
jgi:outer membrane receptor protein involved in Fe transport